MRKLIRDICIAVVIACALIIALTLPEAVNERKPPITAEWSSELVENPIRDSVYQDELEQASSSVVEAVSEIESTMSQVRPKKENKITSGTVEAIITHYCACSSCNGKYSYTKDGVNYTATASGITLHDGLEGNYCAATFGKLGDILVIDGAAYEIVDRMGGNDGYRIDIFVGEGHAKCNELGRYTTEVTLK